VANEAAYSPSTVGPRNFAIPQIVWLTLQGGDSFQKRRSVFWLCLMQRKRRDLDPSCTRCCPRCPRCPRCPLFTGRCCQSGVIDFDNSSWPGRTMIILSMLATTSPLSSLRCVCGMIFMQSCRSDFASQHFRRSTTLNRMGMISRVLVLVLRIV
jgi:hypothetical protein